MGGSGDVEFHLDVGSKRLSEAILNSKAYQQSLARKRMSAGALFFDEARQLLLVEPTYKLNWEIPGGAIEENESPLEGCLREVKEELGLLRPMQRLLCVDYLSETEVKTEALAFIFLGGVLTQQEIAAIELPSNELAGYGFFEPAKAIQHLNERLGRRVKHCLDLLSERKTGYMENQCLQLW